jgi:hypothetical protein
MAKHLTDGDVKNIANLIRDWSDGKLTWNNLRKKCQEVFGVGATRQTLFAHKRIRDAFATRKKHIKRGGIRTPVPSSLSFAARRIAIQEALIEELKEKNDRLLEQFVRWQYNAYKYGVSIEELNEGLPRIDRERTDGKKSTELGHERKARRP